MKQKKTTAKRKPKKADYSDEDFCNHNGRECQIKLENWSKLRAGCNPYTSDRVCRPTDPQQHPSTNGVPFVDKYGDDCSTPCKKEDGLGESEDYFWCW